MKMIRRMQPIEVFTAMLVVVTLLLVVVGAVQSCLMRRSLIDSKKALEATQRAFVFISTWEVQILGNLVRVTPKWENSGTTPTRGMFNHISWKSFAGEPSDDYPFPDLGSDRNPASSAANVPLFIGPKAAIYGQYSDIPFQIVKAAADGTARVFFWGWAEYNDVFDKTPRHRTEFCYEMVVKNIEVKEAQMTAHISFSLYRRHNCTDQDCTPAAVTDKPRPL